MSAPKKTAAKNSWELTGSWAGAWKVFAGIGVLGLVGSVVGGLGDTKRFAFSWLFAVVTVLAVALGATFFVLIQRLTSAGWSVTVRRTAEFFMNGLLMMIPLALPILFLTGHLFPWADAHGAHHEEPGHGQTGGGGHTMTMPSLIKEAHAQPQPNDPNAKGAVQGGAGAGAGAAQGAGGGPNAASGQVDPTSGAAGAAPRASATNPQPADRDPHPSIGGDHGVPVDSSKVGDPAGKLPGSLAKPPLDKPIEPPGTFGEAHPHGPALGVQAHGEAKAHAEHQAHERAHHVLLAKKAGYLNKGFFIGRALFYFLVWAFLATRLFGWSTAQDGSKDPKLTIKAQRFSAPGTFLFGLTLTFAGFDWVMSLEPSWFSTIFGVYYFATGVVSSLAVIILVTMALRDAGPLKGAVTVEHFHDLGKLLFGFNVFWAYIGFSQFMLIWYAALPEETTWYHNRWDFAPWATVSMAILLGHFVLPFLWLISRNFKRDLWRLKIGAAILLVMHVVDIYWFVMPNYHLGKVGFSFHWLDITCLMAVAGLYGAFVFFRMTKFPLVPVGDPRLARSLEFQNA